MGRTEFVTKGLLFFVVGSFSRSSFKRQTVAARALLQRNDDVFVFLD
jgi:hypothetical protein